MHSGVLLQRAPTSNQNRSGAYFCRSPEPCRSLSCSQCTLTHWLEWNLIACVGPTPHRCSYLFFLCGLVPNDPWTRSGPQPGVGDISSKEHPLPFAIKWIDKWWRLKMKENWFQLKRHERLYFPQFKLQTDKDNQVQCSFVGQVMPWMIWGVCFSWRMRSFFVTALGSVKFNKN